ncbi:unnamed protein product, partial [Musa textilis]
LPPEGSLASVLVQGSEACFRPWGLPGGLLICVGNAFQGLMADVRRLVIQGEA